MKKPKRKLIKFDLGRCIVERLIVLGMSTEDLAKELGTTFQRVEGIIKKQEKVRYPLMNKLAEALRLEPEKMFRFTGVNSKETDCAIGQEIRFRRKEKRLSQTGLAKEAGITKQCVSKIELGIDPLSDDLAVRFSKILGMDLERLRSMRRKRKPKKVERREDPLGRFFSDQRIKKAYLTQTELAKLIGVSPNTIFKVEKGICRDISLLYKIADALKCQIPEELLPVSGSKTEQMQKGAA